MIAYEGPKRDKQELAALDGYYRYYGVGRRATIINKVDGSGKSSRQIGFDNALLTAGTHWIQVTISWELPFYSVRANCVFETQFEAGRRYRLEPRSDAQEGGKWKLFMDVLKGESLVTTLDTQSVCIESSWPFYDWTDFCRKNSQCPRENGAAEAVHCETSPDAKFGICKVPSPAKAVEHR
jgi:hypothetical protein